MITLQTAAIILAGGVGRRIWPYGLTRNKSALPVGNVPLLAHQLDALSALAMERCGIVAGHHVGQLRRAAGDRQGVAFVHPPTEAGTAPAVLAAWQLLEADRVLVIFGDILVTAEDLSALLATHEESGTDVAALVRPLGNERPQDWLCAHAAEGCLIEVLGHPRDDVTHRLCGAYVFNRAARKVIERNPGYMRAVQVGMMSPAEGELADSIQDCLEAGLAVAAVEAKGPFVDLDKPWHILEANQAYAGYLSARLERDAIASSATVSDKAEIGGRLVVGERSVIGPGVKIKGNLWVGTDTQIIDGAIVGSDTIIGDHCTVRAYCQIGEQTVIGHRCVVGHSAEVRGVFFDNVYAYHYGEFFGVAGEAVDFGAGTVCGTLRFDDGPTAHRVGSRREIPLNDSNATYLGDFVRTGVYVIFQPGAKVGPRSVIGAGTLVTGDVPEETLLYVEQKHTCKKWNTDRYGW